MISVLGLPLDAARSILESDGYAVEADEIRSLKGVDGDSLRVVRQLLDDAASVPTVRLTYCEFKTKVSE